MSGYGDIDLEDGDWVRPLKRGFKLTCCDCHLVHTVNFRVNNGHPELQLTRDKRATAAQRRKNTTRKSK